MTFLETRRELTRLAAVLGVDEKELADLRDQPAEALAVLREAVSEKLFQRHRRTFRRIGKLAGAVPAPLASRIAQAALGPAVSARTAATMEPDLAVKLADSLPSPFLAELSVQLDPRRARPIIAALADERIAEVSQVLLERREHLAMSRFLPVIAPALAVRVLVRAEPRAVLEIANLAEDDRAVEAILEQLAPNEDSRLAAVVTDEAVALDALSLASRLSPTNGARVLRAGLAQPAVAALLAATIAAHDLAPDLAGALDLLDASERSSLVR